LDDELVFRGRIIEIGERLAQRFFFALNNDNIRLEDGKILVTHTGVIKGKLQPD
jgi:hypothetical protein